MDIRFKASALVVVTLAVASLASAQPAEPRDAAMTRTVLAQLDAFRRGDWATAYGFAAAGIQARFSPEAFREMVTGGYAPIARPRRTAVLGTEVIDSGHGLVTIRVEGESGETIEALYELVEEQGAWRIAGVVTKPAPQGELTLSRPG